MTDLTNDATSNLSNGASGASGRGSSATGGYGTSASDLGQSAGSGSFSGAQSESGSSPAQDFALNTTRELENRAYQARDWAMSQSDTVRTQVLEKPFVSVGTAFAAGIVFGLLLRR